MADEDTLFEFPCTFAVKAMGESAEDFRTLVYQLVANHVDDLNMEAVTCKPSRAGKYTSVTVTFTAISKAQIDAVYQSLSAHDRIKMAL